MQTKMAKLSQNAATKNWSLTYDGVTGTNQSNYPTIVLDENSGPQFLTFTITGSSGAKFSGDPIWVAQGAKPNQKSQHAQIPAWQVKGGGKKLVVFDWNDNPQKTNLYYRLNFDDNSALDPIIQNGGGTGGQPIHEQIDYGTFAVVALVAFLIGMLVYRQFFAPRGA